MHHSTLGFCWLDLIALLILIAVIVFFIIRHRKLKSREAELEEQLTDRYADKVEVDKSL